MPAFFVNQEGRDKQLVINMDQTPLLMSMHLDWTLTLPNKADIVAWMSTCNRKNQHILVLVTVTAASNHLKPFIVHKAKPGGLVERKATCEFDGQAIHCCQNNSWCDTHIMCEWINKILALYHGNCTKGCPPAPPP